MKAPELMQAPTSGITFLLLDPILCSQANIRNVEIFGFGHLGSSLYSHLEVASPENYVTDGNGRRTHISGCCRQRSRSPETILIAHSSSGES